MTEHRFPTWLPFLFTALLTVMVGVFAYNAGVAHGLAANPPAQEVAMGWRPGLWFHPFGLLVPLFFVFLWLSVLRGLWWGAPWRRRYGYGWDGPLSGGVPPQFEEWHRRAHEQAGTPPPNR
jgi:hypothetical protein